MEGLAPVAEFAPDRVSSAKRLLRKADELQFQVRHSPPVRGRTPMRHVASLKPSENNRVCARLHLLRPGMRDAIEKIYSIV